MFLFTPDKKIRYDRLLLIFVSLLSVVLAAIVITKSTEHFIDTIYISTEGAQMIKVFDLQLELVDLKDEHITGALFTMDEDEMSYSTDENGEIYITGTEYGKHGVYCKMRNNASFSYNFQVTYDYDLQNSCRIDPEDATHFFVPYDLEKLKIQMVYGNGSVRFIPLACYTNQKAFTYLPDGTEIDQMGDVAFSDGSSIEEDLFINWDGTEYALGEDLYFNESGLVIFEDKTYVNPGRSVYVKDGHLHFIWGMAYDFGNGYRIDAEGKIYFMRDGEEWILLPDGTMKLPDGRIASNVNALKQITNPDDISHNGSKKGNSSKPGNSKDKDKEKDKDKKNPPIVDELTGGVWQQASKLHVFTDSYDLTGGAFHDKDGRLVFCPGSKGTYYFRVATNGNQNVQFSLGLYQGGNLPIPLKFKLTCADGTASEWFSMENAKNVATAVTIDQNVKPTTNYTNYQLTWWWDDSKAGQDAIDTTLGVKATKEDVNYEIFAVLTISCD